MKLSKRERKYRIKLIQENQYDKGDQRILDEAVKDYGETYSGLYRDFRNGVTRYYRLVIEMRKSTNGVMRVAQTMTELSDAFNACATSWEHFLNAAFSF